MITIRTYLKPTNFRPSKTEIREKRLKYKKTTESKLAQEILKAVGGMPIFDVGKWTAPATYTEAGSQSGCVTLAEVMLSSED